MPRTGKKLILPFLARDRMSEELELLLVNLFEKNSLMSAVLSSPFSKERQKMTMRQLNIKGRPVYQVTTMREQQAFHQNHTSEEALAYLKAILFDFKQTFLYASDADYQVLINKKKHVTILKKAPSKTTLPLAHNRTKHYILTDGAPIPFLVELGVMSPEGKVHAQKKDKFRQVNRFLEMVDDLLSQLGPQSSLHIVDFGCGKAYLTFALFYFLTSIKGYSVKMTGIDLKSDVIELCQKLSHKLGYANDLHFVLGDVNAFETKQAVDLVISLHACDTATDAALEKAIRWQSRAILCVPCCQHELFKQVRNEALSPLLTHGILKERFAALATDAARVQLLEALGYQAQIMEFIDLEHTPKNLLIRAMRRKSDSHAHAQQAWQTYLTFKEMLHIDPSLERRFQKELGGSIVS